MKYTYPLIDDLLSHFSEILGNDFDKYRNHVYRVFLNCILQDDIPANKEKYALAAVFHDIGIWTDETIDYLDPSIYHLREYLLANKKPALAGEISSMIYWHHKVSPYHGEFEHVTEIFRRSDWADVTFGIVSFGLDTSMLAEYRRLLPNKGFHLFLLRKIFFNSLKRPFNPLPMFRK